MSNKENELFNECQQVASILVEEIDILYQIATEKPEDALDCFAMLKDIKDEITTDKIKRETRYNTAQMLLKIGGAK